MTAAPPPGLPAAPCPRGCAAHGRAHGLHEHEAGMGCWGCGCGFGLDPAEAAVIDALTEAAERDRAARKARHAAARHNPARPPPLPRGADVLDLFAGPAGWEEGARLLGMHRRIAGVELDAYACATARAAGHRRLHADVMTLNPADFPRIRGLICSPPCPTFSAAGKRTGLTEDYQWALDAITCLGGGECDDACWRDLHLRVADPRTALVVQAARWALQLPRLEWFTAEQVPAVEYLWEDVCAELAAAGWKSINVVTLCATDLGAAARRVRKFLLARRRPVAAAGPPLSLFDPRLGRPACDFGRPSMAQALGWPPGHQVRTRANRRATGGNLFSADGPAWCLTEKARTWERDADRLRLTAGEAGLLQGFRPDYPWQGSRSRQFHQAGDVVSPMVAAAVLGEVTGTPWEPAVQAWTRTLYRAPLQLALGA